jgi:hypothetical protein
MSRIRSRCIPTASARILSGLACALLAGTAAVRAAAGRPDSDQFVTAITPA